MQINSLEPSHITEAKPAAAVPPPVVHAKAPPVPKPAAVQAAEPKKAEAAPAKPAEKAPAAVTKAAEGTEGTKTEITDVKPTGQENAEGEQTFTLKVNGKEYKATQSEIIALAQKARGAEEAMKRTAEVEKLAANLLTNFDNDTMGLLVQRHGKEKAKEIIIAMTKSLIEEEQKTPEQVELESLRSDKKRQEEELAAVKKQQEDEKRQADQRTLYATMLKDIDTALDNTHLPKDKLILTRVLNFLAAGKKANGQAWSIQDAVNAVEVEEMSHASYFAKRYVEGKLPSEKFRQIFGEETFKKLNKEQIDLLKNADKIAKNGVAKPELVPANGAAPAQVRPKRSLSKSKGSEGISEREWRRQHGSLGGL